MQYPNISNNQALLLSFYRKMLPLKANSSLKLIVSGKTKNRKKAKPPRYSLKGLVDAVSTKMPTQSFSLSTANPVVGLPLRQNAQHAHHSFYSSQNQKPPCALCTSAMK